MQNLNNLSNNEILVEMNKLKVEFDALKNKMLADYDKLAEIEKKYNQANDELLKRLKGE